MNSLPEQSLESLFVSKVRLKVLEFFMLNPKREIHLRGAVRALGEEINAVRRELNRMVKIELITTEAKGNRKYFKLNLEHYYIDELMSLFHKSYGLGGAIIAEQKKLGDVHFALLTPAFTKGIHFGTQVVELFLVGDINMRSLDMMIKETEDIQETEIHYSVMTKKEFDLRRKRRDQFITDIMLQNYILLIGKQEEFIK